MQETNHTGGFRLGAWGGGKVQFGQFEQLFNAFSLLFQLKSSMFVEHRFGR